METYTRRVAQGKYAAGIEEQRVLNYNRAIQLYSEAIDLNKEVSEYHIQRGLARSEQSEFNLALQDAQQSILIDGSYRDGYTLIIKCYVALGEVAPATVALESLSGICGSTQFQPLLEEVQLNELRLLLVNYKKDFELKKYDSCLAIMTKAIRISPGALNFQLRRSECMLRKKHFTEAVNIAQKVLSLRCFNAEAHYTLGLIYYHRDMPEIAIQYLECCLQNDEEYRKAKTLRALIKNIIKERGRADDLFKEGKFQEALRVYQDILKLEITDNDEVVSKMWYNCALMQSKLNNTEDAIKNCSKALISNPWYYRAFLKRAECHSKLLKHDECVRDCILAYDIEKTADVRTLFNASLKESSKCLIDGNNTEQIIASGIVLRHAGKYKEAIEKFSAAIKICPMNIKFYEYRIECAIRSENFDSALRDLDLLTLISNNNDARSRLLTKVKCLLLKGNPEDVKIIHAKMHNIDKQIISIFNKSGVKIDKAFDIHKYMEQKKYKECLSLIQELIEDSDMKYLGINYKLMRAECLYNLCDYDKTMLILNEIRSDSLNGSPFFLKGLVLYQIMEFDKAIEQFNECLVYDWDNDDSQSMLKRATKLQSKYSLGLQLYRTEYFEHANMAFSEMLKLLDNINDRNIYYSVLYEQAKCLLECGKYDDCINKCVQISENMESMNVKSLLDSAKEKWKTTRNTLNEGILISRYADIKINEGRSYYDEQDYKKARASFSEAITITSKYSQAMTLDSKFLEDHLLVASYYIKMGDLCQTESILHRLEELKLVDPAINSTIQKYRLLETSVKNAIKFFKESVYHECRFHIDNALKIASASEDFKMISAECCLWLGEYGEALLILESLDASRDDGYIRGMIAYFQNDLDGAMDHLKRCVTSDNNHNSAKRLISNSQLFKKRIQKGNELIENEKFEEAIIFFTESMAVDKKNAATISELHLKCAGCNYQLGYLKECLNECNSALKLVPGFQGATKLQAECKAQIENIEKEKKIANEAAMHIRNGDDFKNQADLEKAIASYTRAIDLNPDEASYYAKRAECHLLFGNFESTLNDARKSTELDGTFIDGHICETKCLILLDETESQKEILEKLEQIEIMENINIDHKKEIFELRKMCKLFYDATASFKNKEYTQTIQHIDSVFLNFPNCITMNYKLMKTECLIRVFRLNEASNNIQQMKSTDSHQVLFLKGLWFYSNDNFKKAVEYFNCYKYHKDYKKNDEVKNVIKITEIIQDVMMQSINWRYNIDNKKLLKTLNTEIAKFNYQKDLISKEISMKLYYQRALVNEKLGKNDDAITDCFNAFCLNPSYVNVLKLRQNLFELAGRLKDSISDFETLLAIEDDEDTRRAYEKLKEYATQRQLRSSRYKNELVIPVTSHASTNNQHYQYGNDKMDNNCETAPSSASTEAEPMIQDDSDDNNDAQNSGGVIQTPL